MTKKKARQSAEYRRGYNTGFQAGRRPRPPGRVTHDPPVYRCANCGSDSTAGNKCPNCGSAKILGQVDRFGNLIRSAATRDPEGRTG